METINSILQRKTVDEIDFPPTNAEVRDAIKNLNSGKQPGKDGIPADIYRAGGSHLTRKLTKLLTEIWKQGEVPQEFKDASIVSLFKKG